MLDALLHGKLSREQENMEDILTSCVFGLLRSLSPRTGLIPFLAECRDLDDGQPLRDFRPDHVHYDFWPAWSFANQACEPDVVLHCSQVNAPECLVAIEAKYNSPKSSEADATLPDPYDQLAREWDNLTCLAKTRNARPVLIYLTADISIPKEDIRASIADFNRSRPGNVTPPTIYWLTWRVIPGVFGGNADAALSDLVRLAKRLNLTFFSGFTELCRIQPLTWAFSPSVTTTPLLPDTKWAWDIPPLPLALTWSFLP